MYAYDDARAYVVNSLFSPVTSPLWAEAQLALGNGSVIANASGGLAEGLPSDGAVPLFSLPTPDAVRGIIGPRRAYFVHLTLYNGTKSSANVVSAKRVSCEREYGPRQLTIGTLDVAQVSRGTYALSTQPDVLDWAKSSWYNTPCSTYSDFADLRALPPAPLDVVVGPSVPGFASSMSYVDVNITNTAPAAVAFLVHLRLVDAVSKTDIWPVLWSDNYFSLMPGEVRNGLTVEYNATTTPGGVAVIADTFNSVVKSAGGPGESI
jgi:hypothetical protein